MIEHSLNENGKLVFKHKTNPSLFAERTYDWVDRIIVIDETRGRMVVQDTKFSTFDLSDWKPMTRKEYGFIKRKYKEINKSFEKKPG